MDAFNKDQSDQMKQIPLQYVKFELLARLINQINTEDNSKVKAYYQLKWETLSSSWTSINQLHEDILLNSTSNEASADYLRSGMFEKAEEKYMETAVFLRQILYNNDEPSKIVTGKIKLPRLNIPDFSGNINDWKPFQNIFTQLVHENVSISELQKYHFLKTSLKGDAAILIQHMELSAKNYATAWKKLSARYDNKRRLVIVNLQRLLSQPTLIIATAQGLRNLHDTTKECLHSLKNLDIDTSSWGPLVEFIILQKFDLESHQLYEQGVQNPTEVQELSTFLKFLEVRFKTFEILDCQENVQQTTIFK